MDQKKSLDGTIKNLNDVVKSQPPEEWAPIEEIVVSDMYKLAVLDMMNIHPIRREFRDRYYAVYDARKVNPVLNQLLNRKLIGNIQLFIESLRRIKDAIFEQQRNARL